jgi:hypothetical protein
MTKRRAGALWTAAGVLLSALLLPIVTNVMSDQIPDSWARYAWISIPAGIVLTGALLVVGLRTSEPAGEAGPGTKIQINSATADGSAVYAAQDGDVHLDGDR